MILKIDNDGHNENYDNNSDDDDADDDYADDDGLAGNEQDRGGQVGASCSPWGEHSLLLQL